MRSIPLALPMQNMLPALPMLRIDPALPMLKIEPALPMLRIDPALPILSTLKILPTFPTLNRLPTPNKAAPLPAPLRNALRFRPERVALRIRTPFVFAVPSNTAYLHLRLRSIHGVTAGIGRATRPSVPSPRVPRGISLSRRRNHLRGPKRRSPSCSASAPHGRWSLRPVRYSRRRCAAPRSGRRVLPPGPWPTPQPRPVSPG
jgi:hypothetical protein